MTYYPVGNRILFQKEEMKTEETTKGGIILSIDETNPMEREKQTVGKIVAIGSKVDKTLGLEIGLKIKYAKHSEVIVNIDKELYLVKDCDIQAIISDEVQHES